MIVFRYLDSAVDVMVVTVVDGCGTGGGCMWVFDGGINVVVVGGGDVDGVGIVGGGLLFVNVVGGVDGGVWLLLMIVVLMVLFMLTLLMVRVWCGGFVLFLMLSFVSFEWINFKKLCNILDNGSNTENKTDYNESSCPEEKTPEVILVIVFQ